MNNNIVFAKKSKGSGGSNKDNGGSSSDTSSPAESSSNDQSSNTPPESDKNQPSSTGSDNKQEQQQQPEADQTICPDGSQPDANGDCPTPPATQSTGPPAGGTGLEQQQQPPEQEQQQQCPAGEHFDVNQNVCVSDTTASEQNTPAVQQQNNGIVGPIGGLPPSALETKNNPPLIPECSAGFKPDGKGGCIRDCEQGTHYESKIRNCQPDNVNCPGETHYDFISSKCESNNKDLPPLYIGQCAEGYHTDRLKEGDLHKCYNNASPLSSGSCAPGWHLLPGVSYKICVADSPPVTKTDVIEKAKNPTFGCPPDTHEGSTPGQCVDNTEQLPNGQCADGWHHQTINDAPIGKCTRDIPQVECPQGYHPANIQSKIVCVKDETMPSTQQPQPTQTGGGGGTGTGGTTTTGQGGGTGTQQPQTVKCGKDTHPDPKTGTCTVNDVPLANGACAAGYHFGKDQSICIKDTTTIPPKNCEAGSHYDTNYRDCIDDRYPILSKSGIGGTCVAGYHLEADKLCHKDTTTATMPNQKTTCATDQHLDGGKCVDNNIPLSNGKCVPGYHVDTKPAITKQVGFCIKDEPSSKPPTTEPSTVPPINGACMEPEYHLGDDNLCHKDVITTPSPSQTPTSGSEQQQQQNKGLVGPAGGLPPGVLETKNGPISGCTGETHFDVNEAKCVDNTQQLPSGGCVPGYHVNDPFAGKPTAQRLQCIKDEPSTTKPSSTTLVSCDPGYHNDKKTGACVFNTVQNPDGTCQPGWKPQGDGCLIISDAVVNPNPDGTCQPGYHIEEVLKIRTCNRDTNLKPELVDQNADHTCPAGYHITFVGDYKDDPYKCLLDPPPKTTTSTVPAQPSQPSGPQTPPTKQTENTGTTTTTGNPTTPATTTSSPPTSTSTATSSAVNNVINNNKNVVRGGGGGGGSTAAATTAAPAQAANTFLTYVNAINKITIKYPSTWTKTDLVGNPSIPVMFSAPTSIAAGATTPTTKTSFVISITPSASSLDTFTQQQLNTLTNSKAIKYTITDSNAKVLTPPTGISAFREVSYDAIKANIPLKGAGIFFVNGGTGYSLLYLAKQTEYTQNLPMVQQMVNSFQVGAAGGSTSGSPVQNVAAAGSSPR